MEHITTVKHSRSAKRLQRIVISSGMRASDISRATGISRALISRYLAGEYSPSPRNAAKLAKFFNVSPEWIRGIDDREVLNKLTENYNSLNDAGKERVLEYSELLKNATDFISKDNEEA